MAKTLALPAGTTAEEIKALATRFVARNLRVFGSRATGCARPGGDLDLLVELEPGRDLFDLIEFKHALEERTGAPVDVVTEGGLFADSVNRSHLAMEWAAIAVLETKRIWEISFPPKSPPMREDGSPSMSHDQKQRDTGRLYFPMRLLAPLRR